MGAVFVHPRRRVNVDPAAPLAATLTDENPDADQIAPNHPLRVTAAPNAAGSGAPEFVPPGGDHSRGVLNKMGNPRR